MTDVVSAAVRSRMMSRIRSRDTKPEMLVRRFLHARGFRFRLSPRELPGSPDIVLPRHAAVIFVHGCFWHGHSGCRFAAVPATRIEFWKAKISANQSRDTASAEQLRALGWRVAVIWECALRSNEADALRRLAAFVESPRKRIEIAE